MDSDDQVIINDIGGKGPGGAATVHKLLEDQRFELGCGLLSDNGGAASRDGLAACCPPFLHSAYFLDSCYPPIRLVRVVRIADHALTWGCDWATPTGAHREGGTDHVFFTGSLNPTCQIHPRRETGALVSVFVHLSHLFGRARTRPKFARESHYGVEFFTSVSRCGAGKSARPGSTCSAAEQRFVLDHVAVRPARAAVAVERRG